MPRYVHRVAVPIALVLSASVGAAQWPQFRGPGATGVAADATLPITWSRTENVAWRTETRASAGRLRSSGRTRFFSRPS